jgi:hypothetical protein
MTRQDIVNIINEKMSNISEINSVFEHIVTDIHPNELPALIVKDTDDEVEERFIGSIYHSLSIDLDILVMGANTSTELRNLIKIVVQEFGNIDEFNDKEYIGSTMKFESADDIYGGATLSFIVKYETVDFDI